MSLEEPARLSARPFDDRTWRIWRHMSRSAAGKSSYLAGVVRSLKILLGAGGLYLILWAAYSYSAQEVEQHSHDALQAFKVAEPSQGAPWVNVAVAETTDLPVNIQTIGRIEPSEKVLVKSRVSGELTQVLFTEGVPVKAGDPLFQVDPRPYRARVIQAEAQLARDEAQLIAARTDLERAAVLVQKGHVSRQAYDQQLSRVRQYSSAAAADQGALEVARLNLAFTTVRAPIDGRVGRRLVDGGNVIRAADGTTLVEIVQAHPIALVLTVPQDVLPELRRQQQSAPLVVEACDPKDQSQLAVGHLVLIGNEINEKSGTIELKALFDNAKDTLWPGQFVTARLVVRLRKDVVAVPLAAIRRGPQGRFVYVVNGGSAVVPRPVQVGVPAHGLAVVESGVAAGEKVVVDRQDELAPGMVVRVKANQPTLSAAAEKF
jgi:multidrug efflux system membrane fusion protein